MSPALLLPPIERKIRRAFLPLAVALVWGSLPLPAWAGEPTSINVVVEIPFCGNGLVEGSEECDDGNSNPGDGCDENCKAECEIFLTEITGARKSTVGNLAQLADPHKPGRIFIDTIAGGNILANPDEQNVILNVFIFPPFLDPTEYEVLWEAKDPDDPADHVDIDPNDGGMPTGGAAKGGDNIDKKPEEATDSQHFFRLASHAISDRASPGSDPADENKVIGTAKTQLDVHQESTVKFHYGDEGGDNYIITAQCVEKATGDIEGSDVTDTLTVWRERFVDAYSMDDPADGNFRILADRAAITAALRTAYANPDANKNAYLDTLVDEPAGSQATSFFDSIDCDCPPAGDANATPATCQDIGSYAIDHTNFHVGGDDPKDDHTNNLYQLLGVRKQMQFLGDASREPHSYIPIFKLTLDRRNLIVGVKGEPFNILFIDAFKITVADEDGANSMNQDFDFAPPGMWTAAQVVNFIITNKGALPITASVRTIETEKRVLISLMAPGNEGKTLEVNGLGSVVCVTLGIQCGVVHDDEHEVVRTTVHELGHLVAKKGNQVDSFDGKLGVHTLATPCAFYQTADNTGVDICPKHVLELRKAISRSWSDHQRSSHPTTIIDDSD